MTSTNNTLNSVANNLTNYVDENDQKIDLPLGKVLCVGQNYADHIKEMSAKASQTPMLFMKPNTALADAKQSIKIPTDRGECHNELEVALLIKQTINKNTPINLDEQIWGVGLALDLTLREVQANCKKKGHPWERAKSFDGSCPVSHFVEVNPDMYQDLRFQLKINNEVRQSGHTANMIFDIETLLNSIREQFTLLPGDLVLTGTPKGVGPLLSGDKLSLELVSHFKFESQVA